MSGPLARLGAQIARRPAGIACRACHQLHARVLRPLTWQSRAADRAFTSVYGFTVWPCLAACASY